MSTIVCRVLAERCDQVRSALGELVPTQKQILVLSVYATEHLLPPFLLDLLRRPEVTPVLPSPADNGLLPLALVARLRVRQDLHDVMELAILGHLQRRSVIEVVPDGDISTLGNKVLDDLRVPA